MKRAVNRDLNRVMTTPDLIIRHQRMPILADARAYIADADDYDAIRENLAETPETRLYRIRMESCLADSYGLPEVQP